MEPSVSTTKVILPFQFARVFQVLSQEGKKCLFASREVWHFLDRQLGFGFDILLIRGSGLSGTGSAPTSVVGRWSRFLSASEACLPKSLAIESGTIVGGINFAYLWDPVGVAGGGGGVQVAGLQPVAVKWGRKCPSVMDV